MRENASSILQDARQGGYAVGAFNIHNLETFRAVVDASAEMGRPVYVQTTPGTVRFIGAGYLVALAREAAKQVPVPVILHLDHGNSLEIVQECLEAGYPSVMIDGSRLPYDENVALVRQVVALARKYGAAVEAELGEVGGAEEQEMAKSGTGRLTDPLQAQRFVAETGVDSLAVAIGTAHGVYTAEPELDLERLSLIRSLVGVPLVLHGASGVPDTKLREAIRRGISKVNIATDLKLTWARELRRSLTVQPGETDPRNVLRPVIDALKRAVREKIALFSGEPN
ncbi:MAG: tagatose 1,6-diphosphate aldolase GatY/KbaY [Bacillota bacterium]|jgi:tagatose 1,6-diphosphate aldolase GatY/KbaY|nr:tagatose 1,6-diphosphate aldolase GatY/KbaY [Bacillota bacterium]